MNEVNTNINGEVKRDSKKPLAKTLLDDAILTLKKPLSFWISVLLLLVILLCFSFDIFLLKTARFPEHSFAQGLARTISKWGDFYTGVAIAIAVSLVIGVIMNKPKWRIVALAAFFSAIIAGGTASLIRFATGRPRPSANITDGLYGPHFTKNPKGLTVPDYNYNSFPSAHSTTAMAAALPFLVIEPAIGIPLTIGAVLVGWSRFQLNRHHPSDIYIGFVIGGIIGYAFGKAAKKHSDLC